MKSRCARLLSILFVATVCSHSTTVSEQSPVLFIIFMAARNDLYPYAARNIKQLQAATHSDHIKLFVRVDSKKPHKKAKTTQFFIDHNTIKPLGPQDYKDSGDENALVETIRTAYSAFPADNVVLIIWSHGTGGIEPAVFKALNSSELFYFNAKKNRIELERSIGFIDYITGGSPYAHETKGIGFDDSSGNYLTVTKLTAAVERAATTILKKKFSIVACDACMMAGIDVIAGFQNTVQHFVGSQEVVLGTGYRYDLVLEPLLSKKIFSHRQFPSQQFAATQFAAAQFAAHCVTAFEKTYGPLTEDYTHSAIDGSLINPLEKNIDALACTLIKGFELPDYKAIKTLLRKSKHKTACTHFKEPTYIDIDNFYENLLKNLLQWPLAETEVAGRFKQDLQLVLIEGRTILQQMIIANAVGKNLQRARGISIYFPEYSIHPSYCTNAFAAERTHWLEFLKKYIAI